MPIPKKIHYCWFGNGQKNELVQKCIESWKKFCPDCEIIEWNESNYDVSQNLYMKQAYEARRWGFVSDYARLDIIYEHGGIYLDTDVEVVRSLEELYDGNGFFGFEKPANGTSFLVNTGQGFGAPPHNEVILRMREIYNEITFIDERCKEKLTPCPYYNTMVLEELGLKKDNRKQYIGDIVVYPDDYFCPFNWGSRKMDITERTFAVHHFNASWLSEKEKKVRKIKRYIDFAAHLPNHLMLKILGKTRYELLKRKLKKKG